MKETSTQKFISRTDVKIIAGILVFVAGIVAPFYSIKQDVELIKQNHYAHIEAMTKQIERSNEEINALRVKQDKTMEIIIANQTKLEILMEE